MRRFAAVLAAVVLAGLACSDENDSGPSSDATATGSNVEPSILAVQSAQPATFVGSGETYTVTLDGADASTVWFTDRPARRAGALSTAAMLDKLFDTGDAAGPPNAALVWPAGEGQSALAVELMSFSYNAESETLIYEVRVLERHDGSRAR
jgi:hypothetical protein